MKLVIASDIHGSYTWFEKLLGVVEQERPDHLLLLGDLLYHGPRNDLPQGYAPKKVAPALNMLADKIIAVRGNCEAEVDQMVLEFPCMADYVLLHDGERQLFCTHGHLAGKSPDDLPTLPAGSIFISGHTHVKRDDVVGGIRVFNPGSVGLPKDGSHSCGIYENGDLRFVAL